MSPEDPTTPGPDAPNGGTRPSKGERDLIREAIQQGSPRSGSRVTFTGDLPPEGTFPGYELLREIHRGGQGVVYQAIQKATKRKVALKVLHGGPFSGSAGRSRFEREVQVLGQLNHANIVRLHDSGVTSDGGFFYVMDYISGRNLEEYIADKSLSVEDVLRVFLKVCDAVNAAHLKGIIHRDLKPSNVRIDANGEPIVVDFGLAKVAGPDLIGTDADTGGAQLMTLTGQFIGSLPWSSPEQAEGVPGNIDVRTDVYSLGVMFYQMLTGEFPYKVIGNMRDVLDNILRAEPAKPSTIRRQINDEIETIVLKCLNKDRDRRYQTAGELARDLRHYLAGEPIEAKRDSAAYLLSKTLHRYRGMVTAAGVFLGMLVVFAVGMTVLYGKATRAEEGTRLALGKAEDATRAEAAQRQRADANFKAGHAMAMAMVGEIERKLSVLRGATAAREALLREGQAYLDAVDVKASDDPDLLMDLAAAHEKMGNLQGELYMRRLGQTDAAEANFATARKIREELAARLPGDAKVLSSLARSQYRTAGGWVTKRDPDKARAEFLAVIASYDAALALAVKAPSPRYDPNAWAVQRAWAQRALADVLVTQAQRSADGGDAATGRAQLQDAEELFKQADATFAMHEGHAVLREECRRGRGVIEDALARNESIAARWLVASAKKMRDAGQRDDATSQYRAALERYAKSRTIAEKAVESFRAVCEEFPASGEARRSHMLARMSVAASLGESAGLWKVLGELGDAQAADRERAARAEALAILADVVAVAKRLGDEDTGSLEARRDVTLALNRYAQELRGAGRFPEAEAAMLELLRVREDLLATDPIARHEIDVGVARHRLGQVYLAWAKAEETGRDDRLARADEQLRASLAIFERLRERELLAQDHPYLTETRALMDEVATLRKPRGG
ncbi:MAG: hypothetical protein HBSAPP03_00260 [Phycisphaerae bacterium]|nr:MAG: hypothetical protein HBSAPP03_00260 [Phycisphaerae bacterium]